MNIFFDTSTLFKLYHTEVGTEEIDKIFTETDVKEIYLSVITKIEFDSVVWRKIRMQEISEEQATELTKSFAEDYKLYNFVEINNTLIKKAKQLVTKYGKEGLRTLDSIQLASAILVKDNVDINKSADKLLNKLFKKEGLSL